MLCLFLACTDVTCGSAQGQPANSGEPSSQQPLTQPFESAADATDIDAVPRSSPTDASPLDPHSLRRLPPVDYTNRPDEPNSGSGLDSAPNLDSSSNSTINSPLNSDSKRAPNSPLGLGPGLGMGPGGQGPVSYKTFWFPNSSVKGQNADFGVVGQDLSLACPVWIDSPNTVMATAGVRNRLINTDAILPDSHLKYPSELWDAQVGLMYLRQLDGDRMIGGGASLGSASDHPFASIDEMNVSMNAMYRMPSGPRNAWTFMVMYSPTSEIQFPIPGASYNYNPSDQFHANIGLPFMVCYKPTDRWSFDASYMLIHTIHARAAYQIAERIKAFGGYDWTNEVYTLRDRTDNSDRFFTYDQRVSLGLEMPLASWLTAECVGGYAFDRYSYSGQQWNSTNTDRVNMAPTPYLSLSVSLHR
jgi:hypothetical protein